MTELEMIRLLERQIDMLKAHDVNIANAQHFLGVGEWLLAFEGVYVEHKRRPDILAQEDVTALTDYFGEDMSELDAVAAGNG